MHDHDEERRQALILLYFSRCKVPNQQVLPNEILKASRCLAIGSEWTSGGVWCVLDLFSFLLGHWLRHGTVLMNTIFGDGSREGSAE